MKCYAVISSNDIPDHFLKTYSGAGFVNDKLLKINEIKKKLISEQLLAVLPGAETGVYCAEQLADFFKIAQYNDPKTSDWRRKKSAMQARLANTGLDNILTRQVSVNNINLDGLESKTGYVIKPNNSCGTDDVVFLESKQEVIAWLAQIDWNKKILPVKRMRLILYKKN